MKILPLVLVLSFALQARAVELFHVAASVVVKAPIQEAFAFAGNAANDHYWRTEVNRFKVIGGFSVGSVFIEDAKLGIHPHYITRARLIDMRPPYGVVYRTLPQNRFYLRSTRLFEPLSPTQTRVIYKVDIEKAMIRDILGVALPPELVSAIYSARMRRYLRNLRRILQPRR